MSKNQTEPQSSRKTTAARQDLTGEAAFLTTKQAKELQRKEPRQDPGRWEWRPISISIKADGLNLNSFPDFNAAYGPRT
jgi:hypothetical protein